MSFLQINNPDGTSGIKRPFRLSDIQSIWSGISQLFSPQGVDSEPRIVSGFGVYYAYISVLGFTTRAYRAGVVAYKGNLYSYNPASDDEAIRHDSPVVFARISTNDVRAFEDGSTRSFSDEYVCGTSLPSGATVVESFTLSPADFASKIESLKTFVGLTDNILVEGSTTSEIVEYSDNTGSSSRSPEAFVDYEKGVTRRVILTGTGSASGAIFSISPTPAAAENFQPKGMAITIQNASNSSKRVSTGGLSIELAPSQIAVAFLIRIMSADGSGFKYATMSLVRVV